MNLEIFKYFISDKIGIINQYIRHPRYHYDPKINLDSAIICNINKLNSNQFVKSAGGCGFKKEDAFLSTIGEVIERYSCCFYNLNSMIFSNINEIRNKGINVINSEEFSLFHSSQFNEKNFQFVQYTNNSNLYYTESIDLINNKKTYAPASCFYIPFLGDGFQNQIMLQTSTGLASHTNIYEAILSSIYEVIERDALSISWIQKLKGKKIKITNEINNFINKIFKNDNNYILYLLDITLDIKIPTVLTILKSNTDSGDIITIGCACRFTYKEAIEKSILEAAQSIPFIRFNLNENNNKKFSDNFKEIISFEDHALFYNIQKNLRFVFDTWINNDEFIEINYSNSYKNAIFKIRHIIAIFKKLNYNILFKEISTNDIKTFGFRVVKIYIPQLIPLSGNFNYYFLGGKRIYKIPENLGYKNIPNNIEELKIYPHPLP